MKKLKFIITYSAVVLIGVFSSVHAAGSRRSIIDEGMRRDLMTLKTELAERIAGAEKFMIFTWEAVSSLAERELAEALLEALDNTSCSARLRPIHDRVIKIIAGLPQAALQAALSESYREKKDKED